jgi:hypothetical protein
MAEFLTLEPETRIVWASAKARAEWEPKVALAAQGYLAAERSTVASGARQAGQLWLGVRDYMEFLPWAMEHGLTVRVVRWTGEVGGFTHSGYPEGDSMVVVAFGRDLKQPYEALFGYPECCQEFFAREFPNDPDPIPAWGAENVGPNLRILTNPLLRYIGARAVPHIPCGGGCQETEQLGEVFLAHMPPECREPVRELLALAATWDRYRGVAIVTTPHFKVIATSTARPVHEIVSIGPWVTGECR